MNGAPLPNNSLITMKRFKKPGAILEEITTLRKDERYRREDRAKVSEFFNGAPPLTDEEAEELNITVNVNHLFGYTELAQAASQALARYTKPTNLFDVTLNAAPPGKGTLWGMEAATEASRVLRKITGFKTAYIGICGDATKHGEALMFYPNKTFPLPRQCPLSKMLIPSGSPANVIELPHFAIEHELSLRDLHWYWEHAPAGWNTENLKRVLDAIYKDTLGDSQSLDPDNIEELEYARQENSATSDGTTTRTPSAQVVYFYEVRCDKPGYPIDLTIMLRQESNLADKSKNGTAVLYEREGAIPSISDCLHPFFMDCILGGAPKWHRILGLGTLNYQTNFAVELLVNRAQQATYEGSMNLWTARDTATREAAQQILMKHNGVLPEGLNMVQNRFAPNFAGILEMIQFFRQAGSKNARGVTPNAGDGNDQLEVQALFEQNLAASTANARTANWDDYADRMWEEAFSRLTNPLIDSEDPGYSEVMDFQTAMKRRGIPLYYLQPENVQVRGTRLAGDGMRSKELGIVQYLTTNRSQYAPEVQPKITRMCTALALDNYTLAEELTPIQEEPDSPQRLRAESENAIMLTTRKLLPQNADDVDELHVQAHFPAMEQLVSDGVQFQKAAFTPPQADAFQKIGAHTLAHIERIEAKAMNSRKDPEREKAREMRNQLNQLAAMGEKLLHNMEQAQQGQEQQMDPTEQARLQLEIEKLQLSREKLTLAQQKFERTQGTREQALAFDQMLKLEKDRRESQSMKHDAALRDVETAVKVQQANKPQTASAQ